MKPPPRKKPDPHARHYIFANFIGMPFRKRIRPPFQPERINAKLFHVDAIRPFPEWPLICISANRPTFETEADLKKWLKRFAMDKELAKTWLCKVCGQWHGECFPLEISGQTSGKDTRKQTYKSKHL